MDCKHCRCKCEQSVNGMADAKCVSALSSSAASCLLHVSGELPFLARPRIAGEKQHHECVCTNQNGDAQRGVNCFNVFS